MKSFIYFILFLSLSGAPALANKAAIVFSKQKIKVGKLALTVEIADNSEKSARGLMFRTSLADGTGMLFIFQDEAPRSFWMKNTFIPLSIGYFDQNKKLVDIQDMQPVKSEMEQNPKTYPSAYPAKYALEVPKGWFQKHKIKIGDELSGL